MAGSAPFSASFLLVASSDPGVTIVVRRLRQFRRSVAPIGSFVGGLKNLAVGPGMFAPGGRALFVRILAVVAVVGDVPLEW